MHYLQQLFVTQDGEAAWTDEMHAIFAVGDLAAAEAVLVEALAELDSELGAMCLALTPERVVLAGWEELDEAIALHEGDPVTGITIAIANEYDRAFEKGGLHHPFVTLGIYTDEGFAFSRADGATIFAELDKEYPDWSGYEEDIEVHLDIEGLDALNTALLHHKQRHFFRDERPPQAPLRYVEYVVGCWWRALLWQQAVARACALTGLPGAVPVVCGMVEMKPEAVSLHVADGYAGPRPRSARAARAPQAEAGFGEGFIRRRTLPVEEAPPTGLELRRRASAAAAAAQQAAARPDAAPERPRLFGRLFGQR